MCVDARVHVHVYVCARAHAGASVLARFCVCVSVLGRAWMAVRACACTCAFVCVSACLCACSASRLAVRACLRARAELRARCVSPSAGGVAYIAQLARNRSRRRARAWRAAPRESVACGASRPRRPARLRTRVPCGLGADPGRARRRCGLDCFSCPCLVMATRACRSRPAADP